jgi:hypothetical protein
MTFFTRHDMLMQPKVKLFLFCYSRFIRLFPRGSPVTPKPRSLKGYGNKRCFSTNDLRHTSSNPCAIKRRQRSIPDALRGLGFQCQTFHLLRALRGPGFHLLRLHDGQVDENSPKRLPKGRSEEMFRRSCLIFNPTSLRGIM